MPLTPTRPSRIEDPGFMTRMSCHRPFYGTTWLVGPAVAALVLLTPAITPLHAQAAQQAALGEGAKSDGAKSDSVKPAASTTEKTETGNVASVDQGNPAQQKTLTDKAIEKVKQVAKSASDIFNRVPCLAPKGAAKSMGSLPHVAGQLAAGA